MAERRVRRDRARMRDERLEDGDTPKRPPAPTTRFRRRPSGFLKLVLRHPAKADLDDIARCVDRVLATTAIEGLEGIIRLTDDAWGFDPTVKGAEPKSILADKATVERRRAAAKAGAISGAPFRLRPTFPNGLKRRPKPAARLFEIDFATLTLPIRWSAYVREACKPAGGLFDLGYALTQACPDILQASPVLRHPIGIQSLYDVFPPRDPMPQEADPGDWHMDHIAPGGLPTPRPTGAGVTIGHPDTGYTEHSQLNFDANGQSPNFAADRQFNVLPNAQGEPPANADQPADAREPIVSERVPGRNHYHGTRTASVMISDASGRVEGVAPGAAVMPIRCVQDVIILAPEVDDDALAHAITLATDQGAQVISISLGGYPCSVVRYAVQYAVANDVIVVGAAGNYWPQMVFPGAYPECVGVGGSTADDRRWQYSGRNYLGLTPVQISGPAEFVRQAAWRLNGEESAGREHGTSFAVAMVAGAAALWLQTYGRDRMIRALNGRTNLAALFIAHLATTARRPPGWEPSLDGPGILNLTALLDPRTLPDPATFALPPGMAGFMDLLGPDPIGEFRSMFIDPVTDSIPDWLTQSLNQPPDAVLGAFAEELMTRLMADPLTAGAVEAAQTAAEDASDAAQAAADAAADAATAAAEAAAAAAEAAADAAENAADALSEGASDALNQAAGWLGL